MNTATETMSESLTEPNGRVLHLATTAEKDKALAGLPYRTLCGLLRPYLRQVVLMPDHDPAACVVCADLALGAYV